MPGVKPDTIARQKSCVRCGILGQIRKCGKIGHLAFASVLWAGGAATAQESKLVEAKDRILQSLESTEILMLAVFGGAMSFALMSASWLIRERGRMVAENSQLKSNLSQLRAKNDRNEALVSVSDQKIVVWNGTDETPILLGSLSQVAGVPVESTEFLAFGSWLSNEASAAFEPLLRNLRTNADPFDMALSTKSGGVLEAQGRISGAYAYVRIRELSSERESHARMKAEHSTLKNQLASIKNLLTNLPMPVWMRGTNGELTWVNSAYATALELDEADKAIGTDWDLFDQEQRKKLRDLLDNQQLCHQTLPATVAGDRKKLEVFALMDDSGTAGIAFDKSDVDEVRRALDDANDGHARMLDQLATAVAIFDRSQKLIFHNSSFQQLWKLDPAFLASNPSNSELLEAMRDGKLLPEHPDWRKWKESQLEVYTAIDPSEEWWHLLDGQTIRIIASPRNQGGATWVFENVTERLALESNYNSLVRVQGETLDHLNEAVAVFGSDGKLRLFNPALESLWSATELEICEGLHIVRIVEAWTDTISNSTDLSQILGKITGLDEKRSGLEGRLELRNGSTFEYVLVPLPDGQSMLTFSDITANVNFEKALNERAEALEASDQLKSKFIQHVSYELRAPLTNISGFGEMLATPEIGSMNEKQAEYLNHINSSAEELRGIVDDILDLASIDAGTMTMNFETTDLEQVVANISEQVKGPFEAKALKQTLTISDECANLIADRDRLEQVLRNLLSNAIDFSPDGGLIAISAERQGDFHELRISDQGPGISEDQREAIFDRFETQPQQGARKGVGLGLSIVRGFIELHGGQVFVENVAPQGACFICRIPVRPELKQSPLSKSSTLTAAA